MLKTNSTDNDLIGFRKQVDIQLKEMMQENKRFWKDLEARLMAEVSKLSANHKK